MQNKRLFTTEMDFSAVDKPPIFLGTVKQLDGVTLKITPLAGYNPMTMIGVTPKLYAKKPNGEFVYQDVDIDVDLSTSQMTIQCKNFMFSDVGTVEMEIELYDDDNYLRTSPTFEIDVTQKLNQLKMEDLKEGIHISLLEELMDYIAESKDYVERFKELLSEFGDDDTVMLENLIVVKMMLETLSSEVDRLENTITQAQEYEFEMANQEIARVAAEEKRVGAEVLRVQAETNRVNEEAKRRTTEQGRVSAETNRVNNENTRKANEATRQTNETQRVEAETQRQSRYNSFIVDAEANANNFENYTNNAKVKEEERKANELDRKSQENRRVSNEIERISNENTRKASEVARENNETSRQNIFENKVNEVDEKIIEINTTKDNFISSINTKVDTKISELNTTKDNFISSINTKVDTKISELNTTKENFISSVNTKVDNKISELDNAKSDMTTTVTNKVNEVETRFNALTSSQQQDAEVIDARDGETSLKARLDRDIEKAKQIYVNVEGNHISTDSSSGYAKDVEILGNTIQDASNLADIRSVGDTVEGQELYEIPIVSRGKNLISSEFEHGELNFSTGENGNNSANTLIRTKDYIVVDGNRDIVFSNEGLYQNGWFIAYDKDYKYIKTFENVNKFTTPVNCKYIRFRTRKTNSSVIDLSTVSSYKIQLEYGTVATPYEPYVEDKLTILSPVQLEKVGDVADRIIEKDGVWGVEKNVKTTILNGSRSWTLYGGNTSNTFAINFKFSDMKTDNVVICDKLQSNATCWEDKDNNIGIHSSSSQGLIIRLLKSYLDTVNVQGAKDWLQANLPTIKYPTTQPQFIPLPHSQQIKLRTFANKTNISFGCEIEGTIKAQVPKSIGATVNTHTEQINNLNKELDRVKKLEESTVSTVTTESDFTTVEATNGGYFEDVKLEGKTLVNLFKYRAGQSLETRIKYDLNLNVKHLFYGKLVTLIPKDSKKVVYDIFSNTTDSWIRSAVLYGTPKTVQLSSDEYIGAIYGQYADGWVSSDVSIFAQNCLVLEGDHTQNPPNGYIKGLKSVGQDVDEISVESVKNLLDYTKLVNKVTDGTTGSLTTNNNRLSLDVKDRIEVCSPQISVKCRDILVAVVGFGEKDGVPIYDSGYLPLNTISNLSLPSGVKYITINSKTGKETPLSKEVLKNVFIYHQSDKKRLLYYNNETQAWEKPILRQWDSIEKHADGKYYYHQRSGEVVLNGSENWGINTNDTTHMRFSLKVYCKVGTLDVISDKFSYIGDSTTKETIFTYRTNGQNHGVLVICIDKSKLSTQDVQGFKQWLQANNVTVVYQLAQEKVYECTNIDLITYANETNYIVESGAIVPKTTLKVHNNISNVVSLLQKKVSLLEDKFIQGLKQVLAGDMYSLAELLYPEDFISEEESIDVPTLLI